VQARGLADRPGRGCHDAISAIYNTCKGPRAKQVWALDADLAAAFDKIDHTWLLGALGTLLQRRSMRVRPSQVQAPPASLRDGARATR
jgi:RNA-directed DNA polymerase